MNTQKLGSKWRSSQLVALGMQKKKTKATYLGIAMGDLIRPVVGARSEIRILHRNRRHLLVHASLILKEHFESTSTKGR